MDGPRRTGDRARHVAVVGEPTDKFLECLRRREIVCRQAGTVTENLCQGADGVVMLRDPSPAEWQVIARRPRRSPVFLSRLPGAHHEVSDPLHFVPDVLFRPGLLTLGAELGRRRSAVRWIEWQAPGGVDRWLHDGLPLLVHWFGEGFRSVSVDAWNGDHLNAHLAVENGPSVAVEVRQTHGSRRRNVLRAKFGDACWTARFDAGGDELTVGDGPDARTTRFAARRAEHYLARYIADVIAGSARNFFGTAQAVAAVDLAERIRQAWRNRRDSLADLGEVVLVKPPRYRAPDDVVMLPPLGLARLQAWLKAQGFTVRMVDLDAETGLAGSHQLAPFRDAARVEGWLSGGHDTDIEAVVKPLASLVCGGPDPALVGFSITDVFEGLQARIVLAMAHSIRRRLRQSVPIVVGGDLEAIGPNALLGDPPLIDFVVYGDGEHALTELVQAVCLGDRPVESIAGVRMCTDEPATERGRFKGNERPVPDFSGVPLDRYRRGASSALRPVLRRHGIRRYGEEIFYLPYAFVDGCNGRCVFCSWGGRLDIQQPQRSVADLLELSERYETDCFYLLDTTVNVSRRALEGLVEGILRSGRRLYWTDSARPHLVDGDLARGMAEAGCVMLSWGVESGSDAVLGRMGKGFTADEAAASLQAAHEAGILNRVNLIAGFFHETDDDINATEAFLVSNRDAVDLVGCFQGFYLFPDMDLDSDGLGIRVHGECDTLHLGQRTMTYDELGGLDWPQKKQQIERSYVRVKAHLEQLGISTFDKIDDYDLFHIARLFDDKATRKAMLLEASMAARVRH